MSQKPLSNRPHAESTARRVVATDLRRFEDPWRFSRESGAIEGSIAATAAQHELPRVLEAGCELAGDVVFRFDGEAVRREGRGEESFLHLDVQGVLSMQCQRCLGPMKWAFELQRSLLLVRSEQDFPEDELEEDAFDAIEVGRELDLLQLLEDEILLALPIAPRHESCDLPDSVARAGRRLPFAGLAALKGGQDDSDDHNA